MAAAAHPRTIGEYAVLRFLGEGGAGRVYACRDPALDRDVAVKILRREVAQDKTRRDRFLREGRMMARIHSPHVASIFAVGEHNGVPFLVMELLEGQDLETRLKSAGRIPVPEALTIVRQACLGLDAAERLDVIHRDVKPANIVQTPTGAKLTDFGLARPQDGSAMVTSEGMVTGTPAFLAPERAMGKGDDLRSDIYSLGATLYTLIAGQPPFVRETPIEVITAQLREEPPLLEQAVPSAGGEVGRLVRRMMQKAPDKRPRTYAELIEAIDICLLQGVSGELTQVNDPFGATSPSTASGVGAPTGVMGSLRQMSLTDITQMLEIGRKTAGVDIEPSDGVHGLVAQGLAERGEVSVVDGQVVFARMGPLEGDEAYYALVRVTEGAFRIRYGRPGDERNIDMPTQFLMLEAMRRVDEAAEQPTGPMPRPSMAPDPISALEAAPVSPRGANAVRPDAPTVRSSGLGPSATSTASSTALPPSADVGSLDNLPDAPPPIEGLDVLDAHDTVVVQNEHAPARRGERAVALDRGTSPPRGERFDELDDRTAAFPTWAEGHPSSGDDDDDFHNGLDGPTAEQLLPDLTASDELPTHSTPDSVGSAASFDDDDTDVAIPVQPARSALDGLFAAAPWLRAIDSGIAKGASAALARVRAQPAWLAVAALPVVVVVAAFAVLTSSSARDLGARLAEGDANEVLRELEAIPAAERTARQETLLAQALIQAGQTDRALAAIRALRTRGGHDETLLPFLIDQLDTDDAGPAIDLLVSWPGDTVTDLLVAQTEREAYAPRRHAVTALEERGEGEQVPQLSVATKNLRDAPSCNERRLALGELKDRAKAASPAAALAARQAVEAAATRPGNECMLPMLKAMLPHRFQ